MCVYVRVRERLIYYRKLADTFIKKNKSQDLHLAS